MGSAVQSSKLEKIMNAQNLAKLAAAAQAHMGGAKVIESSSTLGTAAQIATEFFPETAFTATEVEGWPALQSAPFECEGVRAVVVMIQVGHDIAIVAVEAPEQVAEKTETDNAKEAASATAELQIQAGGITMKIDVEVIHHGKQRIGGHREGLLIRGGRWVDQYVATCPQLSLISTVGETPEAAIEKMRLAAIEAYTLEA